MHHDAPTQPCCFIDTIDLEGNPRAGTDRVERGPERRADDHRPVMKQVVQDCDRRAIVAGIGKPSQAVGRQQTKTLVDGAASRPDARGIWSDRRACSSERPFATAVRRCGGARRPRPSRPPVVYRHDAVDLFDHPRCGAAVLRSWVVPDSVTCPHSMNRTGIRGGSGVRPVQPVVERHLAHS